MVDKRVKIKDSDYNCNVEIVRKEPLESSILNLTGCPAVVEEKEQLLSGFERGQTITIEVFKTKTLPSVIDRTQFISFGGEKAASMVMKYKRSGNLVDQDTLEVFHLEVDESERGKGLGSLLMNIIYAYSLAFDAKKLSMTVGGGQDTIDFFISQGIQREDVMPSSNERLAIVDTEVSSVNYNSSKISVIDDA